MSLFLDGNFQKIKLYDINNECYIFKGFYIDLFRDDNQLEELEVQYIDNLIGEDYLEINVIL